MPTMKPGDPRLPRTETHLVATPQIALEAAAAVARDAGVVPFILGDAIEGEARDVGKVRRGALQVARRGQPFHAPACCCPAESPPSPCAARDAAAATSSSCCRWRSRSTANPASTRSPAIPTAIDGRRNCRRDSCQTPSSARGHWAIRPRDALDDNDGHGFFEASADSVVTRPTLTNVNDFRAILITGESGSNSTCG